MSSDYRSIIREVEEGLCLLVYDLPYDPRNRRLVTWYKWACSVLRHLGYPIQYSVVLLPISKVDEVEKAVDRVIRKLEWNGLKDYIPQVDVKVIRFSPKEREDLEALIDLFKSCLKESMEYAKREAMRKLKEEDYSKVREYLQKILRNLKRQDALKLIERDEELKSLYASLSTLVVGI